MKYWLITTEYPPFFGGGISTYCYHTACMLTQNGHEVTVLVNDRSVKTMVIQQLKEAQVVRFNPEAFHTYTFLGDTAQISYAFAMILKKLIEEKGRPDIIESQEYNGIAYFFLQFRACLFDWCKGIPLLLTMHSPGFLYQEYNQAPVYKRPNFWIGEMERFSIQAADACLSPSQYLIDELRQRFEITNPNLHVVPNPFKYEARLNVTDAAIMNDQLTFYGKLSPQKGSFAILEKFKKLWDNGFTTSFTMIGGQEIVFHPLGKTMGSIIKKQYRSYIRKGLLKLRDKISPEEREEVLSGTSLFIIPSIVDNLPYAVLELMSTGKIVMVSRQGGQSEIVTDGVDGFVFDYQHEQGFEQMLKKVLNLTKEQRLEIAEKAAETIRNTYSYAKIYETKIRLVQQLLTRTHQGKQFPLIRKIVEMPLLLKDSGSSLLSVIIPYYNLGTYLEDAIQSVLASTYERLEILIINDGSTQRQSINALENYRHHSQIRVIDKPNTGLADSRNKGAEAASGEFITFLDADDKVAPAYYEKAINILKQYENIHFIGAWTQFFEGANAAWPTFNPEPPLILTHNTINSSALVYKKQAFLQKGRNDPEFKIGLEDYESVVHLKAAGFNGVAIPELLFLYRVRKGSMIKASTPAVRSEYYQKIASKHKTLFQLFNNDVKELIQYNGPALSIDNATLDELPFQTIPFMRPVVQKMVRVVKSNPVLKKVVLKLRKIMGRQ